MPRKKQIRKKDASIDIKIEPDIKKAFDAKCQANDVTMTSVIRAAIFKYLGDARVDGSPSETDSSALQSINLTLSLNQMQIVRSALSRYYYTCKGDSEFREQIPEVTAIEDLIIAMLRDSGINNEEEMDTAIAKQKQDNNS